MRVHELRGHASRHTAAGIARVTAVPDVAVAHGIMVNFLSRTLLSTQDRNVQHCMKRLVGAESCAAGFVAAPSAWCLPGVLGPCERWG